MDTIRHLEETYSLSAAVCHAGATNGVFTSIFASEYHPMVYDDDGRVPESIKSLPEVLQD